MKPSTKRGLALAAIAVLSAAALTIAACKSPSVSVDSSGRFDTPLGPVTYAGRVGLNEQTFEAHNDTQLRFRVRFYDAAGNVVGEGTITEGGTSTGPIPEGAATWQATSERVPSSGLADGGGMFAPDDSVLTIHLDLDGAPGQAGGRRRIANPESYQGYIVIGGPLWFDLDSPCSNAVYSFVVEASTGDEASQLARDTIEAPVDTPIPPQVTVQTLFVAELGMASASVIALAQDRFTTFEMDANGVTDYATLGNGATQTSVTADLWRITAPVQYADIHGYGFYNWVTLRTQHGGNASEQETYYEMIHID